MTLREAEASSIRAFLESVGNAGLFSGRVLDYGAGQMPYADLVRDAGGEYHAFDRKAYPASVTADDLDPGVPLDDGTWDAILVTQVLQYVPDPSGLVAEWFDLLRVGGHLVLTGKTSWPDVEAEDLGGMTIHGIRHILNNEGFSVIEVKSRAEIQIQGEAFSLGYGAIGRKPAAIIYALCDPQSTNPRYVGQTTVSPRRRLQNHMAESQRSPKRPVSMWIRALDGQTPFVRILETDPVDANDAEREWYVRLVREGYDLLNVSVGRRGSSTPPRKRPPMSAEQRAKVSAQWKGKPKSAASNAKRSVKAKLRAKKRREEGA